ncbi:TfoX/Sxy family protein [Blastopirellula sp. JC732]|uniref:TfoX/Sxy family protein n=1 Tax=Blastopirellula sediminis TaxID=2894196 RepID=A0A9X1MPH6_9BACT|nr:TfoX/Sxy family protein [Blastopirellula sediminis]MCC9606656.1 TfoX/Sxy family protein [Blastopirellula sediminis]MCC9630047.1 TfoX/Sxy family protein [Blastopirellula sediminis]
MAYDEQLASRIRGLLQRKRGVTEKRMFGGLAFLLHGNMLVGVSRNLLIARIGPDAYEEALEEENVREFDFTGRPMRGWVVIDEPGLVHFAAVKDWTDRAFEFVKTLPKK